jgi:hypothetical protein
LAEPQKKKGRRERRPKAVQEYVMYCNGTKRASPSLDGRVLRHLNARQRACLAANILAEPGSFRFSVTLLAHTLNVSPAYIGVARQMSAARRAAILAGYDKGSFVPLLNPPKSPLALPAPKLVNGIDDAEVVDFVREVGIGRVLDAAVAVERAAQ